MPSQQESSRIVQTKTSKTSQQQQRISGNFLPTPAPVETTVRAFYPTPRPSPKPPQSSQSVTHHVTQHIHVGVTVPQLKPHQITINLPPPDIQRIVQNPSPLLPSQSRVIVTAKASVSDESGRPLNTTQLVTLPLPTIPASYDDYKEGDESFDPFYRDVPKIRKSHQSAMEKIRVSRGKRSLERPYHFVYGDSQVTREPCRNGDNARESAPHAWVNVEDFRALKESLIKFRDILFRDEANEDASRDDAGDVKNDTERAKTDNEAFDTTPVKHAEDNAIRKVDYSEDLLTEAAKHLDLGKTADKNEEEKTSREDSSSAVKVNNNVSLDKEEHIKNTSELEVEIFSESTTTPPRKNESRGDVIILDSDDDLKVKAAKTDALIEIIIEEETKSGTHDVSKTHEKVTHTGQITGYPIKEESGKQSNAVVNEGRQDLPRETARRKDVKESGERKPGTRRKGSRPRSSRRRMSSRIRQQKTENAEEVTQQEEDVERMTTTASTITPVGNPVTVSTTTVTPPAVSFKAKVAEQIDSNIFRESETETFKEVDTRAIGRHDATYSKGLQSDKSQDAGKNKEMERSFDRQIAEGGAKSSGLRDDKAKEEKQETESTHAPSTDKEGTIFRENPQSAEDAGSKVARASEEKNLFNEGFPYKEYEFPEDDEVDASTQEGETEGTSREVPSTVSSDEVTTSREGNLEQEGSYREDASERSSTDVLDEEGSTARYSGEVSSEELNEYQDTESSAEGTRGTQEDYRESTEGATTFSDYISEEYTDSQEDVAASTEETEGRTEGVLKFTDELPDDRENADAAEGTPASGESGAHDYVDDNYEPENYKGTGTTTQSNESEEDESVEKSEEEKKDAARNSDRKDTEQRIDDSVETQTEYTAGVTEVDDLQEIASLTTTSSTTSAPTTTTSTTMAPTTTAPSTTTASTTTTAKTTTRRPTTTTPRATSPKLFKPTGNRRIYAYSPPTTTPVPVVIKPRAGLFNPKPAKPPKSYNELAPKPMIRKLVLSRKLVTTTTEKLNTENPEMTTEPLMMTTATAATVAATTAATTVATTKVAATTETSTIMAATEAVATTTTGESSKSEENGLESKLEVTERTSSGPSAKNDQANKEDQFPSPSEQNTPVSSSSTEPGITTAEIEASTPRPPSRSPTLASSIERTTEEVDVEPRETTEGTDLLVTTVPPTTLLPEKSERAEVTPTTEKYLETAGTTTTASTSKAHQQKTPSVSSTPPIPDRATSVSILTTVLPRAEDADSVASMEAAILRSSGRKPAPPRKHASFNCLEKEMYRFYGDARDCRLFHYCSPGFTSRQVLDFRFVCEEGTAFDEVTQSCRHDVRNRMCRKRW